jgi:tetratricopeptide (TPR) repeat protein
MRNYVNVESHLRPDVGRPLVWLGEDYARQILRERPDSVEGWKNLAQIELFREPLVNPSPRFRMPFDPVFDLSLVRATYALGRALALAPSDFVTLVGLRVAYESRVMNESLLPILDRIVAAHPINLHQVQQQSMAKQARAEIERKLGSRPSLTWRNLSELDQIVTALLVSGRAATAADLLEKAHPPEQAAWQVVDQTATLRLHLGEPARARSLIEKAATAPSPAARDARIGTAYFVEGDFDAARTHYRQALAADPASFEARYSLAVLEQDAGDAIAAHEQAAEAIKIAPNEATRLAARVIASSVARFSRKAAGPVAGQADQGGLRSP